MWDTTKAVFTSKFMLSIHLSGNRNIKKHGHGLTQEVVQGATRHLPPPQQRTEMKIMTEINELEQQKLLQKT